MSKNEIKVSVIVPVYNNGFFLRDTLTSLQKQTLDAYEVIVVNDGSTDNSDSIIDEFVNQNAHFIKISQKNQGVSAARNAALKIAKGKYVTFVDGDDTIPENALQEMDNIARNYHSDLVIGGIQRVDGTIKKVNGRTKKLKYKRNIQKDDLDLVHGLSLCNKWFLKEIIDKHELRLEPFRHLEDGVFLYNFLQYAERIDYCDSVIYNYIKRVPIYAGSVTQKVEKGLLESAIAAFERMEELTKDYAEAYKQELLYRILSTTFIGDYYKKIWNLDTETEKLLLKYSNCLWNRMDEYYKQKTIDAHVGLQLEKGLREKEVLLNDCIFTIVLTSNVTAEKVNYVLKSLYSQSVPAFRVVVEKSLAGSLNPEYEKMRNLSCESFEEHLDEYLVKLAAEEDTRYLMVIDKDVIFDYDTLVKAYTTLTISKCKTLQIAVSNAQENTGFSNIIFNMDECKKDGSPAALEKQDGKLWCTSEMLQTEVPFFMMKEEKKEEKKKTEVSALDKMKRKIKKMIRDTVKPQKPVEKPKQGSAVLDYYFNCEVDENIVLLEGIGKHIKGNILYIIKELKKEKYSKYKIYVSVTEDSKAKVAKFLEQQGISDVNLVVVESKKYKELLASAKYLVNEVYYPNYWVKKEEQCSVNIWHGTPLKKLGAGKPGGNIHGDGPAQRNFVSAKYMLFPNEFTKENLLKDCYVDELMMGDYLMLGYPRTGGLLENEQYSESLRARLAEGKNHIVAYMPTYRDDDTDGRQIVKINELFDCLEEHLPEDYLVYVNLHHKMNGEINYAKYKKIKQFPADLDTYQVLAAVDCLCTDYSSLMFDFGATGKNVVLYCYDLKDYTENRGVYLDMKELPFVKAVTAMEVLDVIQKEKQYDDSEFLEMFCKFDSQKNAEKLCECMLQDSLEYVQKNEAKGQFKPIMVYSDGWHPGKTTDMMYQLAKSAELTKKVYLSYRDTFVEDCLNSAYPLLNYFRSIGTKGDQLFTDEQKKIVKKYQAEKISFDEMMQEVEKSYKTEICRCYDQLQFEKVVLLDTMQPDKIIGYAHFACEKYLFVHDEMQAQMEHNNKYLIDAVQYFEQQGGKVLRTLEEVKNIVVS